MDLDTIVTTAILWLPGTLVFLITMTKLFGRGKQWSLDSTPATQTWRQEASSRDSSIPATPIFVWKDLLETPHIPVYTIIVVAALITGFQVRRDIARLKTLLFRLMFVTLFVLRFLSSASGTLYIRNEFQMWLPISSSSPLKGLFLHWMINLPLWNRTFLGRYCDRSASEGAGTADASSEGEKRASEVKRVSWRDAVVRLAYYHILDSTANAIWLRYFRPYTTYVNNSEILTVVFVIIMVAWTWLKVCIRSRRVTEVETRVEEGRENVTKAEV